MRRQPFQLPVCPQPRPPALAPPGCRRGASTARGPAAAHPPSCLSAFAQSPLIPPECKRLRQPYTWRIMWLLCAGSTGGYSRQNNIQGSVHCMTCSVASLYHLASLYAEQQQCIQVCCTEYTHMRSRHGKQFCNLISISGLECPGIEDSICVL